MNKASDKRQRSQMSRLTEDAAAQLINLEAACALGIEGCGEIAHGGGQETQREIDGIRDFVRDARPLSDFYRPKHASQRSSGGAYCV